MADDKKSEKDKPTETAKSDAEIKKDSKVKQASNQDAESKTKEAPDEAKKSEPKPESKPTEEKHTKQTERRVPAQSVPNPADLEEEDDLEPLIKEFLESKDAIQSMLVMFRKLKQAGIVDFIDQVSDDYLPSDIEFIGKFLSSREFTYGVLKSANTMLGLMYALSRESTSDALKALMFDSEGLVDAMIDGAKNPERMSMMRLFAMTKDPEIASGLTAVLNMLKELGKSLQKVKND